MDGQSSAGQEALEAKKLCERGSASACRRLGMFLMEGSGGVAQDLRAASDAFGKACAAKNAHACHYLGMLHNGFVGKDGGGLPRNPSQAASFFRASCSGKLGDGCYAFAELLAKGEIPAEIDAKVDKRVRKFFGLACEYGVGRGCVNVGVMQLDGIGDNANISQADRTAQALEMFKTGCVRGDGIGCGYAGNVLMQRGEEAESEQKAAEQFKKASDLFYAGCAFAHGQSCVNHAQLLDKVADEAAASAATSNEDVFRVKARAVMFFRRACELSHAEGCQRFAEAPDALKDLDTRSQAERQWLCVGKQ